jgi:DNA polymerase-3 subunit epsilon
MTMSRALAALSMREIVIDTETTGLDPLDGHRIVEIGAVELVLV